jgi:peroxiredoxin
MANLCKFVWLALCSMLLSAASAYADPVKTNSEFVSEIGLVVGDRVPEFVLRQSGTDEVKFDDIVGEKGGVLMFIRSADWCPFCAKQMKDMQVVSDMLKEQGYPLVAIVNEGPEITSKFTKRHGISYDILSDDGSTMIKDFGLLNEGVKPKSRAFGTPHPAVYIVGKNGVILSKLMEESYKVRPPAAVVLYAVSVVG